MKKKVKNTLSNKFNWDETEDKILEENVIEELIIEEEKVLSLDENDLNEELPSEFEPNLNETIIKIDVTMNDVNQNIESITCALARTMRRLGK